jgi:DNA-binding NtrC family response regulator/class 3 adenylate cyclase/tetratricopeptide (TPR) repeat protein
MMRRGRPPASPGTETSSLVGTGSHWILRANLVENSDAMERLNQVIGRGPRIVALREQLRALLAREAGLAQLPPILITGETGTGKGLVARTIHQASSRAAGEFVELNGAAIPEHLLESELFGYERGAFTDARRPKPGLLQVAHRGTLFLDEVGLLPLSLQAKLLKVLEDGSVRRLGSTRNEPVDIWIISATNEDLPAAVRTKRFRGDLYHRLAVITLALPPLRELGDDIDLLADHALARACEKYSVPIKRLSPEAQAALRVYRWPGNVRELNSVIERAVLLCRDAIIPVSALALGASPEVRSLEIPTLVDAAEWERQNLSAVLAQTGWNISRTAAILGITRNTVRARIARHGLRPLGLAGEGRPAETPEETATDSDIMTTEAAAHGARVDSVAAEGGLVSGRVLEPVCPACGASGLTGSKFCRRCGGAVTSEAPGVVAPHFVAPEIDTPRHLAEKILTSKRTLEGERKHVTVLFVDVVDSSRLVQQLDAELTHEIMDRLLRLMTEMVHRYEGTVSQYLGDGLMALFGAPIALEDHALRAVRAALSIQETVGGYSEQLKRERGVELRLRFGLNTGPVIVGSIGDNLRMDYTTVGDTTDLAARMQELASPGAILVSDATHRLLEGYFRTESLGVVPIRGRPEPVPVFRVTGRLRRRTRLEVSADLGLTELIGRQREHAVLEGRLANAMAGRGQVVAIVGEAGIGKSRLVYEFRKSLGHGRVTWLEAHCSPDGQSTPYGVVLEILNANFEIEEGDSPIQIDEKLRRGLRRLGGGLERILPSLREPFGLPSDDDTLKHLTPQERRRRTFEAIQALTVAGSQRRPHVLVIEDLHWIDKTSEQYLAFFIESLAGIPVLLITTHRSGYMALHWTDKSYYTQIALDQLSTGDVEVMVERLLGTRNLPLDLARRVYEKAEGNPLFVEEIVASLRERGLLIRHQDGFAWAPGAVIDFPGTLHDIIRARLDRLEEPVKRTVQTAAVIGRQFGFQLLARVSAMAQEIESYLATLKHLELVHEVRFFPDPEYIFKHAVIQDAAYQSLLRQRRKALHGAIGQAIEDIYADHLEEYAAILAYQYARSDQPGRALRYALVAGDRAARVYANVEAAAHYEQALEAARALPPSPDAQRMEIDATIKLATVGITRQDTQRNRENMVAARALAESLDDRARLAGILYWTGRIEYVLGNTRTAIEYAERSLKIAEGLSDDALTAPPTNLLGRLHWQQGSLKQAITFLEQSTEQMLRLGNTSDAATTAGFAGIALADAGELTRAVVRADQGVRLAQEIQNPFAQAATHYFRGHVRSDRGEWVTAIEDFVEGRGIAEKAGDRFRVYTVKVYEGRAHTKAGDPRRGRAILEECIAIASQLGTTLFLSRPKAFLAECLLELGEIDAASRVAEEAVRLAEESGERHGSALAYRALAEALFRGDPPDMEKAEETLLRAIGIQQENGEGPELGRSYAVYVRLLLANGDRDRAREMQAQATTMFRDMGMAWDLDAVERII